MEFWTDGSLGKFRASLRLDLPYVDEFYASAKPPRQDEEPREQGAPVTPDLALGADEAVRRVWLGRHDAWMVSLGRGTVLVDRTGTFRPDSLLP
ncbi:hypothetical protein RZS08_54845, partial [Arthrospira platensis SPKY1]|nr:hypothetical protein [Arthrospira platensis SPKY1]